MAQLRFSRSRMGAAISLLPAVAIVASVYLGSTLWAFGISLTNSRMLPNYTFIGLAQYFALFDNDRWQVSIKNLVLYAVIFIPATLAFGFFLAALIDRRIRGEGVLRTIYLMPFALSFIVTGLIWRWLLNPTLGIQAIVRGFGFQNFTFDWIVDSRFALITIVVAAVWHGSGLVMVIALAGLRGVDEEIWKALRVEGVPVWRCYLFVILPMLGATIATATVLLSLSVVRLFDIVIAMTGGGPGDATEVPAKFVIDYLLERQQIGLASAASIVMLLVVMVMIVPWLWLQYGRDRRAEA